jgi:hypothetical protein
MFELTEISLLSQFQRHEGSSLADLYRDGVEFIAYSESSAQRICDGERFHGTHSLHSGIVFCCLRLMRHRP